MGLTVHYKLKFKGEECDVVHKLSMIHEVAKKLGFKEVTSPWYLDYSKDFNNDNENKLRGNGDDGYRWAKIQLHQQGNWEDNGFGKMVHVEEPESNKFKGWVIRLWAGDGCEPTNIGLVSKDGENWIGQGFTKTQYAENFVKAHMLVIMILDACQRVGILEDVNDEGDFWKTRDVGVLGENINKSTEMIMGLSKMLQNSFGSDSIVSSVDACKNFVKVQKSRRF